MKKLSPAPDIRSILDKGIMSGDVKEPELELAKKFNERYYHWEEMRYRIEDAETRKRVWFLMKLTRMTNSERLRIGGVEFSYSLTSNILRSLFELERALSGHLEYHGKEIGGERMRYYQVSSFVEEAISSSILEGAAVTRADAKQMIRKKRRPVTEGERMVMNNYLAMENIKRIKDEELTPKLIKDMHRIISCGTLKEGEEWEGMFREEDDIVVGDGLEMDKVFHVPPSHGKVPRMIEGLCDFCNMESGEFIPPIVKGIILHFMIGYIHPFVDGNGRLARSLFYWYAIKKGYWIMEYAAISKVIKSAPSKYGMAYQYAETDENDLTYFIKFNVEFIMRAVKELEQHVESKVKKQKEARLFVIQNPQFNMRQAAILSDYMKDDAPFTIVELQRRYRCAYQTMRLDVMALEDLGLIRAVGKVRKAVKYIVDTDKMYEFAVQKDQKMQKNTTDKTKTAGTERNTQSKIADFGR